MLFAVPDAFVCAPPEHQAGCDPDEVTTSYRNRFYGNMMGRTPKDKRDPNGIDFWWDSFPENAGNCWYDNTGKNGTKRSITTCPSRCPSNCETSAGDGRRRRRRRARSPASPPPTGDHDASGCPWFVTPPEPQVAAGARRSRQVGSAVRGSDRRRAGSRRCPVGGGGTPGTAGPGVRSRPFA